MRNILLINMHSEEKNTCTSYYITSSPSFTMGTVTRITKFCSKQLVLKARPKHTKS